jgi:hypothetical protein
LSAKVKAIHEISRLIWLEQRLNQQAPANGIGWGHYRNAKDPLDAEAKTRFDDARLQLATAYKASEKTD